MNVSRNRPDHATHARNDCTVRALATTSGLPYDAVANVLYQAGRRPDRGFAIYDWLHRHNGKVLGCDYVMCLRHDAKGIFLVGNNGHCAAIVDGTLHDEGYGLRRYRYCYRVVRGTHDVGELDLTHRPTPNQVKRDVYDNL